MGNAIEDRRSSYIVEQEREATVRFAKVDDNTVTGITVSNSTVHCLNDATVLHDTVCENIVKHLSNASQPETTEIAKTDMEVQCSEMMQKKLASCKEEKMTLLIEKAVLKIIYTRSRP